MKDKTLIAILVSLGVVVSLAVFLMWMNSRNVPQTEDLTPQIETGSKLYASNCLSCHGDQQAGLVFGKAPPHNGNGHTWHHSDAELIQWTLEGRPLNMPAFKETLSRVDAEAILAYIKTWWTPQQKATQADISRRYQEALDRQNGNQ